MSIGDILKFCIIIGHIRGIPHDLKSTTVIDKFKNELKTCLFKKAFNTYVPINSCMCSYIYKL